MGKRPLELVEKNGPAGVHGLQVLSMKEPLNRWWAQAVPGTTSLCASAQVGMSQHAAIPQIPPKKGHRASTKAHLPKFSRQWRRPLSRVQVHQLRMRHLLVHWEAGHVGRGLTGY